MFDIGEAVKLVETIHEKALETAALPDVARGCGYANPTSTPFYRRIVAARLFKFLNSPKAELTKNALDYLKPETDDAKQNALTQAIMGIKTYADIVNQHVGRKINLELITNKLEKDATLSISKVCAKICASTLQNSLKFAGFISGDGTVVMPLGAGVKVVSLPAVDQPPLKDRKVEELESDDESQIQTLYLDDGRKRKITIKAPLSIKQSELKRLQDWLALQLLVVPDQPANSGESK